MNLGFSSVKDVQAIRLDVMETNSENNDLVINEIIPNFWNKVCEFWSFFLIPMRIICTFVFLHKFYHFLEKINRIFLCRRLPLHWIATEAKSLYISHMVSFYYSDLPNNCAANLIIFREKKHLHNLIRTYTCLLISEIFSSKPDFHLHKWEKILSTWPY